MESALQRLIALGALLAAIIVSPLVCDRVVSASSGPGPKRCGPGTISFRARPAGEKRFTCSEGSWYDGGKREFAAQLSAPAASHTVTLTVIHRQSTYNGARSGLLLQRVIRVSHPATRRITGVIDFSSVYSTDAPAGAPPFGTYFISLRRGTSAHGLLLASGNFVVIED
jgi:hypothetical protein